MKATIIIDVQVDFVTGALGTPEAQAMIPRLVEKLDNDDSDFIFTQDTHKENYLDTQEGKLLPIPHCIKGTPGWQIAPEIQRFTENAQVIEKKTYGTTRIPTITKKYDKIELCGLCTDICVISNALILRAFYPETKIFINSNCCAGSTVEAHNTALLVMKNCGCTIID